MIEQAVIGGVTATMLRRARPTVLGLTEAILDRESDPSAPSRPLSATMEAMVGKVDQMPPHLKLGMAGLTLAFAGYARTRTGRSLSKLPVERRLALLEEWRGAPLGPCRQFVQFYEKMSTFLYYSLVEEAMMPPVEVR